MGDSKFKKGLIFFAIWILIYFVLVIFANLFSNLILKIPNSINAVVEVLFPVIVILYLKQRNLLSYYGIGSLKKLNGKHLLFFTPMILIPLVNLSFGIEVNDSWQQILLISVSMLGVGFSEEILFRGFLMKAVMNKSSKAAIVLPSIIFGLFHLTNLGGADAVLTGLQVIYATAFGLMCSMFVYRTNQIIPCMICHSATNITNLFLPDNLSIVFHCIESIVIILLSACYAWYLYKAKKPFLNDVSEIPAAQR